MNGQGLVKRVAIAGLMAALIILMTAMVRIPIIGSQGGYIHPGDAVIFMSAFVLGGPFAAMVAGLASALADLIADAAIYMIPSFIVKALMALAASLFVRKAFPLRLLGFTLGGLIMMGGYFLADSLLFGVAAAIAALPWNAVQAAAGVALAFPLIELVKRVPLMRDLSEIGEG